MNLDNLSPEQLRKIDASLAEKVLGAEVSWYHDVPIFKEYEDDPIWYSMEYPEGYIAGPIPHYTTDPAAALSLLDEYGDYYITRLTDAVDKPFRYRCGILSWGDGEAATLPLAIVAAVCEAEGLEVGEVVGGG